MYGLLPLIRVHERSLACAAVHEVLAPFVLECLSHTLVGKGNRGYRVVDEYVAFGWGAWQLVLVVQDVKQVDDVPVHLLLLRLPFLPRHHHRVLLALGLGGNRRYSIEQHIHAGSYAP